MRLHIFNPLTSSPAPVRPDIDGQEPSCNQPIGSRELAGVGGMRIMKNPRNLLALSSSALAVTACLILPGVASAQTSAPAAAPAAAAPADAVGDEVVVTGIRASLERSI